MKGGIEREREREKQKRRFKEQKERKRKRSSKEHGRGVRGGRRERKGQRADRGIIIKRDISYVGGRIVSATRHARRFCVPAVRARALRP